MITHDVVLARQSLGYARAATQAHEVHFYVRLAQQQLSTVESSLDDSIREGCAALVPDVGLSANDREVAIVEMCNKFRSAFAVRLARDKDAIAGALPRSAERCGRCDGHGVVAPTNGECPRCAGTGEQDPRRSY